MSFNWPNAEAALQAWVATGSGLSAVIFENQNGPRPAMPFLTVKLGGSHALGTGDEYKWTYDSHASAGHEITFSTNAQRDLTVRIQAFTAGATGTTARALLTQVQNALALDSVRTALNTAGLAPFDFGTVQDLSDLIDTKFEGRAALEVRFHYADSSSESTGYIAETVGSGNLLGSTHDPLTVNFDAKTS